MIHLSSPKPNRSALPMAATLPVDSIWTRETTKLCRLLSRRPRVVSLCQLVVSCRPLIASPSRRLVAPAGCCIVSHHPLVVPPSHPLVAPACCCINSPRPLVAPHFSPLFAPAGCCVASRCAALPPSHRLVKKGVPTNYFSPKNTD